MADPAKKDEALASAVRDAFQKHMEQARQAALAAKAQKLGTLEPPKPANGPAAATQPSAAPLPRPTPQPPLQSEPRLSPTVEPSVARNPSQPLDLRPTSLRGLTNEPQRVLGAPLRDAGDGFLGAPRPAASRTEAPPRPRLQPPPPVNDFAARKAAADRRDRERELEQRERERNLAERSEAHRLPKAESTPLFTPEPPAEPSPRRDAPVRAKSREAEFEDLLRAPIEPAVDPAPAPRMPPATARSPGLRPEINGLRKPPSSIPSRLGANLRQERLADPELPPPSEARSPVSTAARKPVSERNERVSDTETPAPRPAAPKIELPDLSKPVASDPPEEFDFRFEEATLSRAPSVREPDLSLRPEPLARPLRSPGSTGLGQPELTREPVARSSNRAKAFPEGEARLDNMPRAKARRPSPAPKEAQSPFEFSLTKRNSLYVVAGITGLLSVSIVGALLMRGPISPVNEGDRAAAPAATTQTTANAASTTQQLEPVTATPSRGISQTVVTRSVKTMPINLDQIDVAIQDARERTASGDVARARLMLAGLQNTGDARVLMAMAETFDPAMVRDPGTADARQALRFYEAAQQAGMPGAADRVARLAAKAN